MLAAERFDAFFDDHYPAVLRTVALAVGDRAQAEDATQEAFAKACRRWQRVSAMERPATWVYVVAMNHFRSTLRRDRRASELLTSAVEPAHDPTGSVATTVSIREALDTLPPRQRAAVVLRFLGDLSLQEVAEAMRCSLGTVKSTLHAALRNLRVEIEEEDE